MKPKFYCYMESFILEIESIVNGTLKYAVILMIKKGLSGRYLGDLRINAFRHPLTTPLFGLRLIGRGERQGSQQARFSPR